MSKGTPSTGKTEPVADAEPPPPTAPRSSTPRPGQKPDRAAGKRPPAKRPTQAKKRR
jgi:hypothetical protein